MIDQPKQHNTLGTQVLYRLSDVWNENIQYECCTKYTLQEKAPRKAFNQTAHLQFSLQGSFESAAKDVKKYLTAGRCCSCC